MAILNGDGTGAHFAEDAEDLRRTVEWFDTHAPDDLTWRHEARARFYEALAQPANSMRLLGAIENLTDFLNQWRAELAGRAQPERNANGNADVAAGV